MGRKAVCNLGDVPLNGIRQFELAPGRTVCVVNAGDHVYACQSHCPHEGIALCEGSFDDGVLTCLEHLWQWNLREGGRAEGLAESDLKMFKAVVQNGKVMVSDTGK